MRKIYLIFFFILSLAVLIDINSCKKPAPTEPGGGSSTNSKPSGGSTEIGAITYNEDFSREKSHALDTTAVDISTTDADGIKWDLRIPKQNLPVPITISVTPIKNVKSDSVFNITNGVVFQPDGFQFSTPATLTVTAPSSSKQFIFYIFTQDGKKIEFASVTGAGGIYKIPIYHFSGAAAGIPPNPETVCKSATASYNNAIAEENQILALPLTPPVPPDIDYDCGINSSKKLAAMDYVKQFMMPEDTVIKKILGAAAAIDLIGCNQTISAEAVSQAGKLASRIYQKAQKAYSLYKGDNKKYYAVIFTLLSSSAISQEMGNSNDGIQSIAEMDEWTKSFFNAQLNLLTQNHDYKVIPSLFPLAAMAQEADQNNDYLDLLQKALQFKLELNEELSVVYSDGTQGDHIIINGTVNLRPVISSALQGGYFNGTGDINYVSGYTIDGCTDNNNPDKKFHDAIVLPQSFPLAVVVDSLDLCNSNNIVIKFDSLGSADEQWTYGLDASGAQTGTYCDNVGDPSKTLSDNYLAFINTRYYDFDTNGFTFHPEVQNGNADAVDKTYDETYTYPYTPGFKLTAKLDLKLIHTPQ